jgi:DNA-binding CsgD family transcriptional regulator
VDHRRAAELVAGGTPAERAPIVASFSQALMLDSRFAEAGERAREALKLARAAGPSFRAWEGHALTTLAIVEAWGAKAAAAIPLLEEARTIARELGRVEDSFRATANLTTALAVLGRRDDSIAAAMSALNEIRQDGLEASYGNALRGNIAELLFLAGRWAEAREIVRTALEWSLGPEAFAEAANTLAALEVETASDERAASLLGRLLLELRRAPDPQAEVPASRAAAAFGLWRGDVNDAARAADLGWSLVQRGEDWVAAARMAAIYEEVQAAVIADARERRDLAALAGARAHSAETLTAAETIVRESGVPAEAPSRQEADAYLATARSYAARVDGRDSPVVWDAVARAWERLDVPYEVAKARWRQAEAALAGADARSGRVAARKPIREAARIATELGAAPLAREVRELARRALISLPEADAAALKLAGEPQSMPAAGAGAPDVGIAAAFAEPEQRARDAFGLSAREREVLSLIVDGRTNREIGERLFISQKTVGVHVGNILAKLGASGRVEAAMVAVRLELVAAR